MRISTEALVCFRRLHATTTCHVDHLGVDVFGDDAALRGDPVEHLCERLALDLLTADVGAGVVEVEDVGALVQFLHKELVAFYDGYLWNGGIVVSIHIHRGTQGGGKHAPRKPGNRCSSTFSSTWTRELRCLRGVRAIGIVSFGVACGPLMPLTLLIAGAFGGVFGSCDMPPRPAEAIETPAPGGGDMGPGPALAVGNGTPAARCNPPGS